MNVFEKIEVQQKGRENTSTWMVGEQLKDIIRDDASMQEIVDKDLDVKELSLEKAAGQIKAYADKQPRKGSCVCIPPNVAEKIIREFYGLPEAKAAVAAPVTEQAAEPGFLSLDDYL